MITGWLMARLVPLGIGAAAVFAVVAWDYVRIQKAETRGAEHALADVERSNEKVQQLGRDGAGHLGEPVPGSVRDPRYRD